MEKPEKSPQISNRNLELKLKFDDIFESLSGNNQIRILEGSFAVKRQFTFLFENCLCLIKSESDLNCLIDYITSSSYKLTFRNLIKIEKCFTTVVYVYQSNIKVISTSFR